MDIKTTVWGKNKVSTAGVMDVLNGTTLEKDVPCKSVLVTQESDLASLPDYPAGTFAYTAGFEHMWQLNAAGSWVSIL